MNDTLLTPDGPALRGPCRPAGGARLGGLGLVVACVSASALAQPGDGGVALLLDGGVAASAPVGPAPLIPRALLLGNPERLSPQLSPDGKHLAWLGPDERDVLQLFLRTVGNGDEVRLTNEKRRGLRTFWWAEDSSTLLYLQDADGDENFHLFALDLPTKNLRDLTPWQGVRAGLLPTNARFPDQLLVTLNVRDRKLFDVYRVSLKTGAVELDTQNPGDVDAWLADPGFVVRAAKATTKEGGTELRVRDSNKTPWRALITAGLEETLGLFDLSSDGKSVYLTTSISAETARLVEKGLHTGSERTLAQQLTQDVGQVWLHPSRHVPLAARFDVDGRPVWTVLDYTVTSDFQALEKALGTGAFSVVSMDRADSTWVVAVATDTQPPRYVTWDRKARKVTPLFGAFPKLDGLPLAAMKPVTIPVAGGFTMPGYLTLPVGLEGKRPLVLLVHGGPWSRDTWGFRGDVQFLANRGYAVLQVNYRGSTGFGKRYLNAGNKQWGLAMQDDLVAAVTWARDSGITDAGTVAIMGASYGGYATLSGLTSTPDLFRCGVDAVGPSNLFTFLNTIPPYWESFRAIVLRRLGDPGLMEDREMLTNSSPLFSAERIKAPLLIAQGANDPRVKQAESEQMFTALEKRSVPVTYVLYSDEGHSFARQENRLDFYGRAENFLKQCLAGRSEPMPPEGKVAGSTAVVRTHRQ